MGDWLNVDCWNDNENCTHDNEGDDDDNDDKNIDDRNINNDMDKTLIFSYDCYLLMLPIFIMTYW